MAAIVYRDHQDLLRDDAEALVVPVNCVGVMGAGLAKQFKEHFPYNYRAYKDECLRGRFKAGTVFIYQETGHYIVNFPTKRHWKDKSLLPDIESGLAALAVEIDALVISTIAIPMLGCGLGGLRWPDVSTLIDRVLGPLPVEIRLYGPHADGAAT